MGINICCDVMFRDRKVGRLEIVNSKLIKNEVYTDNLMEHPFPRSKDMMTILEILKGRVICRERFTEEIQRATGLKEYNVYGLLRDNHGLNINEYSWLKFVATQTSDTHLNHLSTDLLHDIPSCMLAYEVYILYLLSTVIFLPEQTNTYTL